MTSKFSPEWSTKTCTLWTQIHHKLSNPSLDRLKSVLLRDVAYNIANVRARNALLRKLPKRYTLYELVMSTDEELLAIPNLGIKSLEDLKQKLCDILNQLEPIEDAACQEPLLPLAPLADDSRAMHSICTAHQEPLLPLTPDSESISCKEATIVQEFDWQFIRQLPGDLLNPRQVEILKAYYGQGEDGETLATIGDRLGLTRERVRQIKSNASNKFVRRITAEIAACAFHNYALTKLAQVGVEATPAVLWTALEDPRVVVKDELWLVNWFGDIYGHDWYTRWLLGNGSSGQNQSQPIAGLAAVSAVVRFLSTCSYRPLSLEEALVIARAKDPTINAYDLRLQLEEHPEVRLFTHGDLQIGHVSWRWFDPQRARGSRQVEWALRLMHAPAPAGEIAQTIRAQLGVMEVSAFGVADACDRNPEIFFQQGDAYGLVIWKHASALCQPLMDLLVNGPLSLLELVDLWEKRYRSSINAELLFAALHHCQDSFCCTEPLYWARKDVVSFDDPSAFTFESLMPTI